MTRYGLSRRRSPLAVLVEETSGLHDVQRGGVGAGSGVCVRFLESRSHGLSLDLCVSPHLTTTTHNSPTQPQLTHPHTNREELAPPHNHKRFSRATLCGKRYCVATRIISLCCRPRRAPRRAPTGTLGRLSFFEHVARLRRHVRLQVCAPEPVFLCSHPLGCRCERLLHVQVLRAATLWHWAL